MICRFFSPLFTLLAAAILLVACGQTPNSSTQIPNEKKLQVVATTNILGDVIHQIAGDNIDLTVLIPVGSDPHIYQPTPQDVAKIAKADLVFINGAGLEDFMRPLLQSAVNKNQAEKIISVSEGISLRQASGAEAQPGSVDPHVWFDPNNVLIWCENIERTLSQHDPAHADQYTANAQNYRSDLVKLDSWIKEMVAEVPPDQRKLVSDHESLGYFADHYGFQQVGAIIPGFSTSAQPSAQELASLEDAIRNLGVKAVFLDAAVNPDLAKRLSEDTNIKLILIYTGSLSDSAGGADTYLNFMRYNVNAIINGLKKA